MRGIEFEDGAIQLDAGIVARGLGVDASRVQPLMRGGEITSLHERGEGEDAGRSRLTFFLGNRRFRLVVDDTGRVIENSAVDFHDRPLPAALRRRGGRP